jgi:hypothetical protein
LHFQVNSFTHIHDSLENSTAHEYFNVSATGSEDSDSGQERWFDQLPPVLFLELSRFQYNTERRVAEKIHNRLEFPDSIFMDRYMTRNKNVTRQKREQVRALKEKRKILKDRLEKFTRYGHESAPSAAPESIHRLSLPEVLQFTLNFAMSGSSNAALPEAAKSVLAASSVMMQVRYCFSGTNLECLSRVSFKFTDFTRNSSFFVSNKFKPTTLKYTYSGSLLKCTLWCRA